MARTKASVGAKVSSGKSSKARCSVAAPSVTAGASGSSEKTSKSYSGGNPVCPRETPKWQKPITNFFINNTKAKDDDDAQASCSKPKKNIIYSDDETEETEKPKNQVLDETIELSPLNGKECHKIEEYYVSKGKNKGKAKKSGKNKENIDSQRKSVKRDLEQVNFGEETTNMCKRMKITEVQV